MKTTNESNKKKLCVGAHDCAQKDNKIIMCRGGACSAQKGITLVALVITIIVMLILVAVTITMAINGGLFEYAGKAVSDMQNAIDSEQQLANGEIKVGDKIYASMEDYINNKPIKIGIMAKDMQSNLSSYLGQTVNYGVTYDDQSANGYGQGKWEIFYADEDHIYLITKGHLANGGLSLKDKYGNAYNGTSDFISNNGRLAKYPAIAQGLFDKTYDPNAAGTDEDPYLKYSSSRKNMEATQYLLDSRNWSTYVNEYAEWAIGGPTLELFVKSYNEGGFSTTEVSLTEPSDDGYDDSLGEIPQDTYLNHYTNTNKSPTYYWLASPASNGQSYVYNVYCGGGTTDGRLYSADFAFRPVVCLAPNVKLILNKTTGEYDLSLDSTVEVIKKPLDIARGDFVLYNIEYTDVYNNKTYENNFGWRLLHYIDNGDGTISNVELISTGVPAKLYHYREAYSETGNNKWWITNKATEFQTALQNYYGNGTSSYTFKSNEAKSVYATAGMYYNFENIPFYTEENFSKLSDSKNLGWYRRIEKNGTEITSDTDGGNLFLTSNDYDVRMLTLPEINNDRITGNGKTITSTTGIDSSTDDPEVGLYRLKSIGDIYGLSGYTYSEGYYWLASPISTDGAYSVNGNGGINSYNGNTMGVRPVVNLGKDITYKVELVTDETTGIIYFTLTPAT